VILKAMAKRITWMAAAEIPGLNGQDEPRCVAMVKGNYGARFATRIRTPRPRSFRPWQGERLAQFDSNAILDALAELFTVAND
jgi:hypothetical protein